MNFDLQVPLKQLSEHYPIVAFDTETSGAYAIESEIIELGAVKWKNGQVIEKFSVLLKPSRPLHEDNIKIHGITNEMLTDASEMRNEILKFCDFIQGSVLIAHHAPFDLGFVAIDIESNRLNFPGTLNLCSSLLSRAVLPATNHRLQTLIKEHNLIGGAAHRAYDDAYACLQVFLKCIEKFDDNATLAKIVEVQKKDLAWNNYQVIGLQDQRISSLVKAMRSQASINIVYQGGQTKNQVRPIKPYGIVRNPDGDYISAECGLDLQRKRFYLEKIKEVELV
ncbi:MAG: polymerase alpha subunit [Pseudobdellovibrio sp.]|jgi:DNA polymerase-3 subunit epsilon|nr:polymerase alpha subunit [Pseudobdellovibrio sp.]